MHGNREFVETAYDKTELWHYGSVGLCGESVGKNRWHRQLLVKAALKDQDYLIAQPHQGCFCHLPQGAFNERF